jgi:hypothetical protein
MRTRVTRVKRAIVEAVGNVARPQSQAQWILTCFTAFLEATLKMKVATGAVVAMVVVAEVRLLMPP